MEIIRVTEMLEEMTRRDEKGELIPFSITFVTCNQKLNTGGEKITFDRAVYAGGSAKGKKRSPNHKDHFTRDIRHQDSDQLMRIHPLLVTKFNGKQIAQ
jgi:hypothetical protein